MLVGFLGQKLTVSIYSPFGGLRDILHAGGYISGKGNKISNKTRAMVFSESGLHCLGPRYAATCSFCGTVGYKLVHRD